MSNLNHSRAMKMVRLALKSRPVTPTTPQLSKKFRLMSEGITNPANVQSTMDIDSSRETEPLEASAAESTSSAQFTMNLASNEPQKASCPEPKLMGSNAPAMTASDSSEETEALTSMEVDQPLAPPIVQDEENAIQSSK